MKEAVAGLFLRMAIPKVGVSMIKGDGVATDESDNRYFVSRCRNVLSLERLSRLLILRSIVG